VAIGPRFTMGTQLARYYLTVADFELAVIGRTRLSNALHLGLRAAPGLGYVSGYEASGEDFSGQIAAIVALGPFLEWFPDSGEYYQNLLYANQVANVQRKLETCDMPAARNAIEKLGEPEIKKVIAPSGKDCADVPDDNGERDVGLERQRLLFMSRARSPGVGLRLGLQFTLRATDLDTMIQWGGFVGASF
jgi:hypothetical protein